MPSPHEFLGLLAVLFIVWIVLKVAQVAVRIILYVIAIFFVISAVYWLFAR